MAMHLSSPTAARSRRTSERTSSSGRVINIEVGGIPFQRLLAIARTELLHCARQYVTRVFARRGRSADTVPVLLAGHQPELFHPGVWFKNFLLTVNWRSRQQGVAMHLITDQDVNACRSTRAHGQHRRTGTAFVPWDSNGSRSPPRNFRCRTWIVGGPLASGWNWPAVADPGSLDPPAMAGRPHGAGANGAGVRLEPGPASAGAFLGIEDVGSSPQPGVWRTSIPLFCVAHPGSFTAVSCGFQRAIRGYRRRYGLRSLTHPFPALQAASDALETPFWIWTADDPRRKPLWIQKTRHGWQLQPGNGLRRRFGKRSRIASQPRAWSRCWNGRPGTKIRPRAVTTTMFARLLLCDLFVHGLGGSKYDHVTDEVLRQFWGITPPRYLTATATIRLPWSQPRPPPTTCDAWRVSFANCGIIPNTTSTGWFRERDTRPKPRGSETERLSLFAPPRGTPCLARRDRASQRRLRQLIEPIRGRLYSIPG